MEALTTGQRIAIETFLSSYDENCPFEKLLSAIQSEDFSTVSIWDQVEYMNTEILMNAISTLSVAIDNAIKK